MIGLPLRSAVTAFRSTLGAIALGSTALTLLLTSLTPAPAQAQAAYGSYVGLGAGFGLTEGSADEDREASGVVAIRYRLLEAPLSLRAQAFVLSDSWALVPTVSYDIPLSWQTHAYVGAGVSIVGDDGTSPVGSKTGFAIQPGIDHMVPRSNMVIFGNAVIAFDAYEDGDAAASLQGGVGLRF